MGILQYRASEGRMRSYFLIFFVIAAAFAAAAPVVTTVSPVDNGTVGGKARVKFSFTGTGPFQYRVIIDRTRTTPVTIQSGSTNSADFYWTTTNTTDGLHTLTVEAQDSTGTTDQDLNITVNNNDFIRLSAPVDNAVVKGTIQVTGRAGGNYQLLLDDNLAMPLTSGGSGSFNFAFNTDNVNPQGTHTITLVVNDGLGSESRVTRTIYIDRTAPVINIIAPGNNDFVKGTTVPIIANIDDPNPSTWEVKVDGGTTGLPNNGTGTGASININWDTTSYSQGQHTITIVATDTAGNRSDPNSAKVTVIVDNTNPTVTLTAPAANSQVNTAPVTITGTVNDANLKAWRVRVDGGTTGVNPSDFTVTGGATSADVSSTLDPSLLSEGTHTVSIIGEDKAGNTATKSVTIIKDNSAPVVTLVNPDENASTDIILRGTVTLSATIQDVSDVDYKFKVDGNQVASGTSTGNGTRTVTFSLNTAQKNTDGTPKYPDGPHTISIEATDKSGNPTTTKSKSVTFKNTAPVINITTPTDKTFVKGVVAINATSNDANNNYTVSVDGQQIASGTGTAINATYDATDAASGNHTITIVATDKAGNQSSKSVVVRVDKDPATVRIVYPYNGAIAHPGAQYPIVIDITDQNFSTTDATQNSVDVTGVVVTIKNSAGTVIYTVTQTRPLDVRTTTLARFTGIVNINLSGVFQINQTYTVEAQVTDRSGNVSTKATATFKVRF